MDGIQNPKIREEFMVPYGLSARRLAEDIHVPAHQVYAILRDKRRITAETSIRLGRYFGVSDGYFLNIQSNIDMRYAKARIGGALDRIQPCKL